MQDFEPSGTFVHRVMEDVRAYEASRHSLMPTPAQRFLAMAPVRYALVGCGALYALDNIARVAFLFVYPAICR